MSGIQIDELSELEFGMLEQEWCALCRKSIITPFQFPQWLIPWWNYFGGGILKALSFRNGDALIGFAPLFIYTDTDKKRKLCCIGSGISDYLDFIIQSGYEDSVVKIFFRYLHDIRGQWDECDFHDISESSHLLHSSFPQWMNVSIKEYNICPYLRLSDKQRNMRRIIPKKLWKNIGNVSRKLQNSGNYQMVTATEITRSEFLEDLFRLHRARWQDKDSPGVLNSISLQDFHRQVSDGLQKEGMFRMYSLNHGGKVIAVYYLLNLNKNVYAYLGGFEPSMERFSPGTLALYHIIEDSMRMGAEIFDFMRGGEPYKSHWGPLYRYNYSINIKQVNTNG